MTTKSLLRLPNVLLLQLNTYKVLRKKRPFPLMSITTGHTFWASPNPVMDQQLEVLKTESVIIKEVAEKSDCVIVGRCADYVLRDEEPFRIFLYAELEFKMKRCRERGDDAKKNERSRASKTYGSDR